MKFFRKLLSILCLFAAIYFLFGTSQELENYHKANKTDKKIQQTFSLGKEDKFSIRWNQLFQKNNDVVGWIKMDSGANYPILHGNTNQTYLHSDLYHRHSVNGSIFLASENKGLSDTNIMIYGHNMLSGAMFGLNDKYMQKKYLKKHPYFYIYTPSGKYVYKIFHVLKTPAMCSVFQVHFENKKEFSQYLKKCEKYSMYTTDVDYQKNHRIATLSTCTDKGHRRFILQGYLESIEDYKGKIKETLDTVEPCFE